MKYSVKFTDTAKSDLSDISMYIVEESKDKEVAKRFVREIAMCCATLEDFPFSGALPNDRIIRNWGYRLLVHKGYVIFYIVEESRYEVYVQAIFNAKKDYTRVLKKYI